MKSYIFRKDFQHRYNKAFQHYVIDAFYKDQVLLADDLLNNKENEEDEG